MPALVVASAGNPASTKIRALPASQALGSTSIGPSVWSFRRLSALRTRRLPLPRIPQRRRHAHVRANLLVLLEELELAVEQELDFRRDPTSGDRLVLVEPRLRRLRRVARGLQHAHEDEPFLVDPELPGVQVARLRADDPDRSALPLPLAQGREIEHAGRLLELRDRLLDGLHVHV